MSSILELKAFLIFEDAKWGTLESLRDARSHLLIHGFCILNLIVLDKRQATFF